MNYDNWLVAAIMTPKDQQYQYQGWSPCVRWCIQNFDAPLTSRRWSYEGEGVFRFADEADLTAFLLRWSQ
jgi:hypothetical protein